MNVRIPMCLHYAIHNRTCMILYQQCKLYYTMYMCSVYAMYSVVIAVVLLVKSVYYLYIAHRIDVYYNYVQTGV